MSRRLSAIGGSPAKYTNTMDYFRGVDLTSAPINVHASRAFNAPNMIRDVPGKVRKRMGYSQYRHYTARINGIYQYDDIVFVHAGTSLYKDGASPTLVGTGLADVRSNAYRLHNKLILLDGTTMWCYDGDSDTFGTAESMATEAQVTVGRAPDGVGGDSLDKVNLLSDKYYDSFLGTAEAVEYQLSFYPLVDSNVTAEKIDEFGVWSDITSTIASVDTATGTVTFSTAPGAPPVSGEDNVRIHAASEHEGYKEKINGVRFGIIYGAGKAMDRLFVSGNPDYPNTDWYCESDDPLYFPDWNYGTIGKEASAITGYTIVDGVLATHKEKDDTERNCYLRSGEITYEGSDAIITGEGEEDVDLLSVKFPITQVIQGSGAIAPQSFAYITEPLYLTRDGVFATTPYEYNGRLYAQKRSFYIDGELLKLDGLANAEAVAFDDFYLLAVGDKVYVLDTLQRDSSNVTRGSQYQYEAYHWNNVPVRCWFVKDKRLYFGAEDGNIYLFFNDKNSGSSYMDNGEAIMAKWEIVHTGKNIHLDKILRYVAINMYGTNNARITLKHRRYEDSSDLLTYYQVSGLLFEYSSLVYSELVYGGIDRPRTIGRKLKTRKYDSAILSFQNGEARQGVSIYAIVLEFTEGRHYNI